MMKCIKHFGSEAGAWCKLWNKSANRSGVVYSKMKYVNEFPDAHYTPSFTKAFETAPITTLDTSVKISQQEMLCPEVDYLQRKRVQCRKCEGSLRCSFASCLN